MFHSTHNLSRLSALSLFLVLGTLPMVQAQATQAGNFVVDQVDFDSYVDVHQNMLYTHDGDDRGFGPEHDLARDNIAMLFEQYGFDVSLHPFEWYDDTYYNVIAEKEGETRAGDLFIIGAHYDSVSNPGADDNASGVAALLEIARIIGSGRSDATIQLIAFDREEQGLEGSYAYVDHFGASDVAAMLSVDMIAYNVSPWPVARVGGLNADSLKDAVADAFSEYSGVSLLKGPSHANSDHMPFTFAGVEAVLVSESEIFQNPYYHTPLDSVDTPDYIDYEYAYQITKGLAGWLVDAAGVRPLPPLGDMNCDYVVSYDDIVPFVKALAGEEEYLADYPNCTWRRADCDGDGAVTYDDIAPFLVLLGD